MAYLMANLLQTGINKFIINKSIKWNTHDHRFRYWLVTIIGFLWNFNGLLFSSIKTEKSCLVASVRDTDALCSLMYHTVNTTRIAVTMTRTLTIRTTIAPMQRPSSSDRYPWWSGSEFPARPAGDAKWAVVVGTVELLPPCPVWLRFLWTKL